MKQRHFRPVRPGINKPWPPFEPAPFDPRISTVIPDNSIEDHHVRSISPRKVKLVGIKVYRSSDLTVADVTTTAVTYNTTSYRSSFVAPAATFTTVEVPYTGVYLLQAAIEWDANGTNNRVAWFNVNGTQYEADTRLGTATNPTRVTVFATRRLTAGDDVGVDVRQNTGGPLDINGGEATNSLSVVLLGSL